MAGFVYLASSNLDTFTNARMDDMIITTSCNAQNILIGNQSNMASMISITSNRVGIAKSNPSYALDVVGDINFTSVLFQNGALFPASRWTSNAAGISILSNVGIGISVPTERLHVTGKAYASGQVLADSNTTSNAPAFSFLQDSNTGMYSPSNDSLGLVTGGVERFRVTDTGFVGVGTATPRTRFTLANPHGNSNTGLCLDASDFLTTYAMHIASFVQASGQVGYMFNVQNNTSSNTAMVVGFNGNIGMGTSNPSERLHVTGKIYSTTQILNNSNDSATAPSFSFFEDSNTGMFHASNDALGFSTGGTERIRVTDTGLVGVGATTPAERLHVAGNTQIDGYLNLAGGNATGSIVFDVDAGNSSQTYIRFGPNGSVNDMALLRQIGGADEFHMALDFHDNAGDAGFSIRDVASAGGTTDTVTTRFTVQRGGNVGIATSNPTERLHVVGNALVTGAVTGSNFIGNGAGLSNLNATHITTGTLGVALGGTGATVTTGTGSNVLNVTPVLVGATLSGNTSNTGLIIGGTMSNTGLSNPTVAGGSMSNVSVAGPLTGLLTVTVASNVGIGTTSPQYTLDVSGSSRVNSLLTTGTKGISWADGGIEFTRTFTGGNTIQSVWFMARGNSDDTKDHLVIHAHNGVSNAINFMSSGAVSRMIIDTNNGNVGIATSNPAERLHVVGNALVTGSVVGSNFVGNGAGLSNLNATHITTGTLGVARGGTGATVMTGTGSNVLNVTPVLVGATLSGNTSNTGLIIGGTMSNTGLSNPTVAGGSMSNVSLGGPLTGLLTLTVASNVGIGTTTPSERLHVAGKAYASGQVLADSNTTSNVPAFSFLQDSNTGMYSVGADTLGLVTGGTERFRITNSGNVGIGTNSPAYMLDVTGPTRLTNRVRFASESEYGTLTTNRRFSRVATLGANSGTARIILRSGGHTSTGTQQAKCLVDVLVDARDRTIKGTATYQGVSQRENGIVIYRDTLNSNFEVYMTGGNFLQYSLEMEGSAWTPVSSIVWSTDTAWTTPANNEPWFDSTIHTPGNSMACDVYVSASNTPVFGVVVLNTGQTGVGTSNPSELLHVAGKAYASGQVLADSNTTSNAPAFSFLQNSNTGFYSPSNNVVGVSTGGIERVRITDTGFVGIGTNTPATMLHITEAVTGSNFIGNGAGLSNLNATHITTGTLGVALGGTGANVTTGTGSNVLNVTPVLSGATLTGNTSNTGLIIGGTMSNTGLSNPTVAGGSLSNVTIAGPLSGLIRVTVASNVGIGAAPSAARLHVAGTAGQTKMQLSNDTTTNRSIVLWTDTTNEHQFYGMGINSATFRFQIPGTNTLFSWFAGASTTASSELMRLDGTGNLGVGTSNPSERLHVAGNAIVSGSITLCNIRASDANSAELTYTREYPHVPLTSTPTTVSIATFQSGIGTYSVSTDVNSMNVLNAFDQNSATFWTSGTYAPANLGTYSPSEITTFNTSETAQGAWVQVNLPTAVTLQSYRMSVVHAERAPRTWVFLGSTNGTTWTVVDDRRGGFSRTSWISAGNINTFVISPVPSIAYSMYRIVVISKTDTGQSTWGYVELREFTVIENVVESHTLHTGSTIRALGYLASNTDTAMRPGYSWAQDTTTGMFRASNMAIGFTTGGTERIRVDSLGHVGIGTSNPAESLHVVGKSYASGQVLADNNTTSNAPAFSFLQDSNTGMYSVGADTLGLVTGGIERFRVTDGGLVGIGAAAPTETLQVAGKIYSTTQILNNSNDSATAPSFSFKEDSNTGMFHPSNDTIGFSTAGTERVRITDTGSVGIGVAAPSAMLHVNGSTLFSGAILDNSTAAGVHIGQYSANRPGIELMGATDGIIDFTTSGVDSRGRVYYNHTTHHMALNTSNFERLRIDGAGNVGIGSTNPSARLFVAGTAGQTKFQLSNDSTTNRGIVLWENAANEHQFDGIGVNANTFRFQISSNIARYAWFTGTSTTASTELMRLLGTGNLGIGTTSPGERLHVAGKSYASTQVLADSNTSSNAPAFSFLQDSNTGMYNPGGNTLCFSTTGAERIRIMWNGNVGVGTTNAAERLHVVGKSYASGQVLADSNTTSNAPAFSFLQNSNTGFYSPSNSTIGVSTAGVERLRIIENGNVGIGKSNPAYTLDITGSINFTNQLLQNGSAFQTSRWSSNAIGVFVQSNVGVQGPANTSNALMIYGSLGFSNFGYQGIYSSNNNIGINTSNPSQLFTVNGSMLGGFNTDNTAFGFDAHSNARFGIVKKSGTIPTFATISGTPMIFSIFNSAISVFDNIGTNTLTEVMRIHTNSNVGINNTAPAEQLHVTGKIRSETQFVNASGNNSNVPCYSFADDSNTGMYSAGADTLGLVTGGVERVRITEAGNVGIGSSNPSARLFVAGTAGQTKFQLSNDSTTNRGIVLWENAANEHQFDGIGVNANTFRFQISASTNRYSWFAGTSTTASTEVMRLDGTGNLSVGGGGAARGINLSNTVGNIEIGVAFTNGQYSGNATAGDATFRTPANTRLHLQNGSGAAAITLSNNNVGIGITNPSARLHVAGTAGQTKFQLSNDITTNRGIVLWENATNEHQFYGMGINAETFRFQIPATAGRFAWFTGTSASASTELMRLTGSGNLGIGTTTPSELLAVAGNAVVNGCLTIMGGTGCNMFGSADVGNLSQTYIAFGPNGTTSDFALLRQIGGDNSIQLALDFHDNVGDAGFSIRDINSAAIPDSAPATRFIVQRGGNVGVGTASPTELLHVAGKIYSTTQFLNNSNDSTTAPSFSFLGDSNTGMFHPSNDTLGFVTGGVERVRIDDNGIVSVSATTSELTYDRELPPAALTGASTVLAAAPFTSATGTYVVSQSADSTNGFQAFDKNTNTFWRTNSYTYDDNVGLTYVGTESTTFNVNETINGAWLQITLPNAILLNSYTIRTASHSQSPANWVLLGSSDNGATWTLVDDRRSIWHSSQNWLTWGLTLTTTPSVTSRPAYATYRIVISNKSNTGQESWSYIALTEFILLERVVETPTLHAGNVVRATRFLASNTDTATAPAYSWARDDTTGLFHPESMAIGITTGGTERIRITNTGIGVGTSNPTALLDVGGTVNIHGALSLGNTLTIRGLEITKNDGTMANTTTTSIRGLSNVSAGMNFTVDSNTSAYRFAFIGNTTEVARITGDGNVGIGTASPAYPLHVAGAGANNISIFAANDIASFSDARVKKDIMRINDALSKVMSISGYTFSRTDVPAKPDAPSKRQCGVLAQEVLAVLPEVVGEDPQTGMYNVAYGNITALLIEAIKEMKTSYDTQIDALNKRIQDLEAKIAI